MGKFKEGDRVRVSERCQYSDLVGKSGTVYAVQPATGEVLVKVDGWEDGHIGAIFLARCGRDPEPGGKRDKWIILEEDLDKIEQKEREETPQKGKNKNMQFKIGDRVENISNDSNRGQKGTIVDCCEVFGTSSYLIRLDDTRRGNGSSFYYHAFGRKNPRPGAVSGYWMLFPEDMRLIESGADEKDGKKPTKRTVVIEITDDGAEAKYFCGGKTPAKQASVRRYHGDKPDDETAAFHALARLFGHKQSDTKDYRERIRTLEDGIESVFEGVHAAYSRLADVRRVLDRIRKD